MLPGATEIGGSTAISSGYPEEEKSEYRQFRAPAPKPTSVADKADEILKANKNLLNDVKLTPEEMKNQAAAFDKFRRSYRKNEAMEDNK